MKRTAATAAAALAMLAAASCATTPEQRAEREERAANELDVALAGLVPGEPQTCVNMRELGSSETIGERTILYRANPGLIYRNDPPGGCPGLDENAAMVTRTPTSQLCSGEIIRVIDNQTGTFRGSCALGEFVPYRRP